MKEIRYKKVTKWYWDDGSELNGITLDIFPDANTPLKIWGDGFLYVIYGIFVILSLPIVVISGLFKRKVYYIREQKIRKLNSEKTA